MTPEEFTESLPRCLSCGEPFAYHRGLVGTCAELMKVRQENVKLREELAKAFEEMALMVRGAKPETGLD